MSVFISYSRQDIDFVDELSMRLVKQGVKVWRDNFEMVVGHSLSQIQQVIEESSTFMLVVLSKNYLNSRWCQTEMGLGTEIEEKLGEVFVLPILLEDCEVPELLANKLFADFRNSFEEGYSELIMPLSKLYSKYVGRVSGKNLKYHIDHSIEFGEFEERFHMIINAVQIHDNRPYSILIQTFVVGNKAASERWKSQRKQGQEFLMPTAFINMLRDDPKFNKLRVLLIEEKPYEHEFVIQDQKTVLAFYVTIRGRLLGDNNNTFDIVFDYGSVIENIASQLS